MVPLFRKQKIPSTRGTDDRFPEELLKQLLLSRGQAVRVKLVRRITPQEDLIEIAGDKARFTGECIHSRCLLSCCQRNFNSFFAPFAVRRF